VCSTTLVSPTVTVTTYSIYGQDPAKRDEPAAALNPRSTVAIAPRITSTDSVPIYASACSGSVRYSSACSCLGITQVPIIATITAPTVTQTVTSAAVTQTSTIEGKQPNLPTSFNHQAAPWLIFYFSLIACSPDNSLLYASGEIWPPAGSQPSYSDFASTLAECCARCFTTKGCAFYEYFAGECYLTIENGGPFTNPYNALCPNAPTGFSFIPGSAFGSGPCAISCTDDPTAC